MASKAEMSALLSTDRWLGRWRVMPKREAGRDCWVECAIASAALVKSVVFVWTLKSMALLSALRYVPGVTARKCAAIGPLCWRLQGGEVYHSIRGVYYQTTRDVMALAVYALYLPIVQPRTIYIFTISSPSVKCSSQQHNPYEGRIRGM